MSIISDYIKKAGKRQGSRKRNLQCVRDWDCVLFVSLSKAKKQSDWTRLILHLQCLVWKPFQGER